jgi:Tfp pilus assembly protein PilF
MAIRLFWLFFVALTITLCANVIISSAAKSMNSTTALEGAEMLFTQGELVQASKNVQEVIKSDPKNGEAHILFGQILASQNKLEEAEKSYQQAAEFSPDSADLFNHLGMLYVKKGNAQGAIKSFAIAIQKDPENVDAYHNMGNIAFASGDPQRAVGFYQKALSLNPNFGPSRQKMTEIMRLISASQSSRQ